MAVIKEVKIFTHAVIRKTKIFIHVLLKKNAICKVSQNLPAYPVDKIATGEIFNLGETIGTTTPHGHSQNP